MVRLLEILDYKIETPQLFGVFHFFWLLLFIGLTILLCFLIKKPTDKVLNRLMFISGIIMIFFEIYKQFVFTFDVVIDDYGIKTIESDYQWYAFPFQFCSIPMYVYLIIPFTKGKVRECLLSFLGTFGLFAGIVSMIYPSGCFVSILGISIQTMVHHGLILSICSFIVIKKVVEFSFKTIIKGTIVFLVVVIIALIFNEVIYYYLKGIAMITEAENVETCNMLYISRHFPCGLPLLGNIYFKVPYLIFLIIYIFGFILVGAIVLGIYDSVNLIISKIFTKKYQIKNE